MNKVLFLIKESEEGGFVAKGLGVPIFTEAESIDELCEAIREAIECHFGE